MMKRWAHFGPVIAEKSSVLKASARPSRCVSSSQSVITLSDSRRSGAARDVEPSGQSKGSTAPTGEVVFGMAPVRLQTHGDGTGPDKDEEQLKKTINSGHAAELFGSRPRSPSLLTGAVIRRVIETAHKRLAENEWVWAAKTG